MRPPCEESGDQATRDQVEEKRRLRRKRQRNRKMWYLKGKTAEDFEEEVVSDVKCHQKVQRNEIRKMISEFGEGQVIEMGGGWAER